MKLFRNDLRGHQRDQRNKEQQAAGKIPPVQCHRDGVAAGFAQSRGGDLDDPEDQRDFRHFAQDFVFGCFTRICRCCALSRMSRINTARARGFVATLS
jgi:hypothetical protein